MAELIPAAEKPLSPAAATAATAKRLADEAVEMADCIVVDSPEMYALAADELKSITARRKKIEELRFSITRPMDEAKSRVMAMFSGPTEALTRAEGKIKKQPGAAPPPLSVSPMIQRTVSPAATGPAPTSCSPG